MGHRGVTQSGWLYIFVADNLCGDLTLSIGHTLSISLTGDYRAHFRMNNSNWRRAFQSPTSASIAMAWNVLLICSFILHFIPSYCPVSSHYYFSISFRLLCIIRYVSQHDLIDSRYLHCLNTNCYGSHQTRNITLKGIQVV